MHWQDQRNDKKDIIYWHWNITEFRHKEMSSARGEIMDRLGPRCLRLVYYNKVDTTATCTCERPVFIQVSFRRLSHHLRQFLVHLVRWPLLSPTSSDRKNHGHLVLLIRVLSAVLHVLSVRVGSKWDKSRTSGDSENAISTWVDSAMRLRSWIRDRSVSNITYTSF
jgi:hypothetical protein